LRSKPKEAGRFVRVCSAMGKNLSQRGFQGEGSEQGAMPHRWGQGGKSGIPRTKTEGWLAQELVGEGRVEGRMEWVGVYGGRGRLHGGSGEKVWRRGRGDWKQAKEQDENRQIETGWVERPVFGVETGGKGGLGSTKRGMSSETCCLDSSSNQQ